MDYLLLEMKMKQIGITSESMSRVLDIDPATFYRKKRGESDFTRSEIRKIMKELNLTSEEVDSIFFKD
jgi:hypothetical protein